MTAVAELVSEVVRSIPACAWVDGVVAEAYHWSLDANGRKGDG